MQMVFRVRLTRPTLFFIGIMLFAGNHRQMGAQELATSLPPQAAKGTASEIGADAGGASPSVLDPMSQNREMGHPDYPVARVLPGRQKGTKVVIESTNPQTRTGTLYTLDKDVVITYGDRIIKADHIEYDSDTGDVVATGHLEVSGGPNSELIRASHGTFNVQSQTGTFYDVTGSVGLHRSAAPRASAIGPSGIGPAPGRVVYDNGNPFLFTGRIVVKKGPQEYDVFDGSVTSCQLPKPDWLLNAALFSIDGDKARAKNSVFHLLNLPLLYLPYVTHPVDPEDRQSGIMIPVLGDSSSKGITFGDEFYLVLGRSMDLTLGSIYYSERGFSEAGTFRYRGLGQNFVTGHFSALQDRGYTPSGGVYTNQGGQDVTVKARYDLTSGLDPGKTRFVVDAEYLSSYIYREAFTDNFNQAVSTDILSYAYGVRNWSGYSASLRVDRYEGLKPAPETDAQAAAGVPVTNSQVTIFHIPDLTFDTTDHWRAGTHLVWSLDSSIGGLKRTQPVFTTGGVGRFDLHPEIALPLEFAGLHIRPSIAVRETLYTRSRQTPFIPGQTPVEASGGFNRADFEARLDIRPPVLERSFDSPLVRRVFGGEIRHTIEPSMTYRYVGGVSNFAGALRFDDVDIVSDTNELEYGVTQRLFMQPRKPRPCRIAEVADSTDEDTAPDDTPNGKPAPPRCSSREFFSWRLGQKVFFDEHFGGAVFAGRRNILDTTLSFSGVAFLTNARGASPIVSRMRARPSEKLDLEWDFDYDTLQRKFTTNDIFADVHRGNVFAGFSYAGLHAPGRFETNGTPSSTTDFSQMRLLGGYGMPTKAGLSVAANAGIDLKLGTVQYGSLQTSYNWNCCGFSVEYRKYELGSVRNENAYRFNFTLANIGTAGNLRRAERLF
jgi:LPS-assembly protein